MSKTTALCLFVALLPALSSAPQFSVDDVPSSVANTRFYNDEFDIVRPSLSLNGFDCTSCDHGLGLRQVLQAVYASPVFHVQAVWARTLGLATDVLFLHSPAMRVHVEGNTDRLQARALIALASYVLEENGENPTQLDPPLPSSSVAIDSLRSALLNFEAWAPDQSLDDDAVKWATPMMSVARALDLYLALENAFQYYGHSDYTNANSSTLLSQAEKTALLQAYHLSIWNLEHMGQLGADDWAAWLANQFGIDAYDVQPGNWPLKVQVALGYAILAQQDIVQIPPFQLDYAELVKRAFRAAGKPATSDRYAYWNFQTKFGKRFWAEGPYYLHYAIGDAIPFWHAARINDFFDLGVVGYSIGTDPFESNWMTKPLEWLADVVTPDRSTPPLDDGKTEPMYNSSVLRWTSAYGKPSVGAKFAWINDEIDGFGSNPALLPVELSIPRLPEGAGTAPVASLGNTSAGQTGENGEQQIVLRPHAGGCCYVR